MGLVLLPPVGLTERSIPTTCCAARARPASRVDLRDTMTATTNTERVSVLSETQRVGGVRRERRNKKTTRPGREGLYCHGHLHGPLEIRLRVPSSRVREQYRGVAIFCLFRRDIHLSTWVALVPYHCGHARGAPGRLKSTCTQLRRHTQTTISGLAISRRRHAGGCPVSGSASHVLAWQATTPKPGKETGRVLWALASFSPCAVYYNVPSLTCHR